MSISDTVHAKTAELINSVINRYGEHSRDTPGREVSRGSNLLVVVVVIVVQVTRLRHDVLSKVRVGRDRTTNKALSRGRSHNKGKDRSSELHGDRMRLTWKQVCEINRTTTMTEPQND